MDPLFLLKIQTDRIEEFTCIFANFGQIFML